MDYKKAAAHWTEIDKNAVKMDRTDLLREIESFIKEHNTCALATGSGASIRCTPIEYTYADGKFYMLSEGGLKFRGLEENQAVSLAVFDHFSGFHALGGMQVAGRAELVEPWSQAYLDFLRLKKIPAENLRKLPSPMYLIKVIPMRIDYLNSRLKEKGVDVRQTLEF